MNVRTTSSLALLTVFCTGLAYAKGPVRANADIYSCNEPDLMLGTGSLKEEMSEEGIKEVSVSLHIEGLTPGKHAVHIHETASCTPCSSAKGHFDPGPHGFTSPDGNHPYHSGDLVNIRVNPQGIGNLNVRTTRVTLSDGPLSLFDEDGSAFIIHVNEDTYCPDGEEAGCAGGGRAACGIIELDKS